MLSQNTDSCFFGCFRDGKGMGTSLCPWSVTLTSEEGAEEGNPCPTPVWDSESYSYTQLQISSSPAASSTQRVTSETTAYFSSRYFKVLFGFQESISLMSPWNYSLAAIFRSTRRACLPSCCCTKLPIPASEASWLCLSFSSREGFPGQSLHVVSGSRWDSGL